MITCEHLTKTYGAFTAVDDISFTVPPGTVTGFLGPNGAGKSTALRMLVGLTPATSGQATVLGRRYAQLTNPGRHVGVLLDASAQHAGRTGRETLMLAALLMGAAAARVDEMLDLVGLTPAESRRRVRHYSLGMRQRLGLAHALLGQPEVLVLDEPANGLDPQGIHWMRTLLKGFAEAGGTVLLSSHLLHEVEVVADDLIVIGRGRLVAQGRKADLLRGKGTVVTALDRAALYDALGRAGLSVEPRGDGFWVDAAPESVGAAVAQAGITLTGLGAAGGDTLEQLFLQLTAADDREGAVA